MTESLCKYKIMGWDRVNYELIIAQFQKFVEVNEQEICQFWKVIIFACNVKAHLHVRKHKHKMTNTAAEAYNWIRTWRLNQQALV